MGKEGIQKSVMLKRGEKTYLPSQAFSDEGAAFSEQGGSIKEREKGCRGRVTELEGALPSSNQ